MKIKYFIFGLLTSLSFCNVVNAATLELKTDDKLIINEKESITVNVNLKLEEDEVIDNISFDLIHGDANLENGENLLLITDNKNSFGYLSNFTGSTATVVKFNKEFTNESIMSFNVKNISPEDGTAQIAIKNVKVKFKDEEAKELTDEIKPLHLTLKKEVTTTTRAKNTSAKLTNFTVNNATIKPAFSEKIKEYKIYVNKDTIKQITIRPTYEQSGVTYEVDCTLGCTSDTSTPNKLNLIMGKNEATFKFTSEDGKSTEEYKFIIYRGPTTDGSNLLASLSLEGIDLNEEFDKSNLDYTVTVPYETENLTVNAVAEDANADVKIKGNENLTVGENVITITVTSAETEEKKIYNITVIREEFVPKEEPTTAPTLIIVEPKTNNNLKLIIIIGAVSLLIIGISAYFIFFHKKKKNKPSKKKNIEEMPMKKEPENNPVNSEPTTVDEALKDLMVTKEIEMGENHFDK